MDAKISVSHIGGSVAVPPSKSAAHRAVLCAALAGGTSRIDNIEYSDLCSPTLTSVINDSGEFARLAVSALLERLRGSYEGEPREFLIPRRLVKRASTAQPQRKERQE